MPQQEKQLRDDYDSKIAKMLQTKLDEEFAKRENEKGYKQQSEKAFNQPGAYNAVDDGNGLSQTVNLISKSNDNYKRASLNAQESLTTRDDNITQSLSQLNNIEVIASSDVPVVIGEVLEKRKWHCPVCNVDINAASKSSHLRSKSHVDKEISIQQEKEDKEMKK
jgi:hypothetical protein